MYLLIIYMCVYKGICLYMCLWVKYALPGNLPFIPTSHLCLPTLRTPFIHWVCLSFLHYILLFTPFLLSLPPPLLLFQMLVLQNQLCTNSLIPSLFVVTLVLCSEVSSMLFSFHVGLLWGQGPSDRLTCAFPPEHCASTWWSLQQARVDAPAAMFSWHLPAAETYLGWLTWKRCFSGRHWVAHRLSQKARE